MGQPFGWRPRVPIAPDFVVVESIADGNDRPVDLLAGIGIFRHLRRAPHSE